MHLEAGDIVYPVPVPSLPTAPGACYRLPRVEVQWSNGIRVCVHLADGAEVETDIRNIRRRRPSERPRKKAPVPRRPQRTTVRADGGGGREA